MTITQEELKREIHYDHCTGIFTWRESGSGRILGRYAGCKRSFKGKMYLRICVNKKCYMAHRLSFLYMTGKFPDYEVDHINGDGIDNRWCNLRDVTHIENQKNIKLSVMNTSGICGVDWNKRKNKYRASIRTGNLYIFLGYFSNIFDAACARKNAEVKYGFHKNHGSNRPL